MRLANMTNAELLRDFDNRKEVTDNEALLVDRLKAAMDEIEGLEREVDRLLDQLEGREP